MEKLGGLFAPQAGSPRGSLRDGDILRFSLGECGVIYGKVTCRSVMYGFAAMADIYRDIFDADAPVKEIAKRLAPASRLLGATLVDSEIMRSGLAEKVGRHRINDEDLNNSLFISAEAQGDNPLAAKFDAENGTYRLNDPNRESEFIVTWSGERYLGDPVERLGLWGVVPNSDRLAELLGLTLRAQKILPE